MVSQQLSCFGSTGSSHFPHVPEELITRQLTEHCYHSKFFTISSTDGSILTSRYVLLVITCMGAGGESLYLPRSYYILTSDLAAFPVQAYLFAQLITVVELVGQALVNATAHWSLMFVVLAICLAFAYYWEGWSSNQVSVDVSCTYRQQYFESILAKPIQFFDAEDNSSGTLTGRVANDPTQLQQLLGVNMAMIFQSIFSLIGCIIIAFVFGWKLTLVAVFVALPIIMVGAFFRFRFEVEFEKMNQEVFAESSKVSSQIRQSSYESGF